MLKTLLNPDQYAFTATALASLFVGTALGLFGFYVLLRERDRRTGMLFFLFTACISIWLLCFGLLYASSDPEAAMAWLRTAYVGVTFIPALGLSLAFAVAHEHRSPRQNVYLAASFLLSAFFLAAALFTDTQINGLYRYSWGYYPRLAPAGLLFLLYFAATAGYILRLFWAQHRNSTDNVGKKRFRWLFVAFGLGYLAAADFIADFGIPVYPFGYLVMIPSLLASAYVITRYRLIDLTPELAAGQILETMQSAVLLIDLHGNVRAANRMAQQFFASDQTPVLEKNQGTGLFDLPDEFRPLRKIQSPVSGYELSSISIDGTKQVLSVSAQPIRNGEDILGVVIVAHDISERKTAEDRLRESEERFRTLSLASFEGLAISQDGIMKDCNEQLTRIFGCSKEDILERPLGDFIPLEWRDAVMQSMRGNSPGAMELEVLRKDGSRRSVEMQGTVITYRGREHRITAVRDITDKRNMEAALFKGESLMKSLVDSSADSIFIKDLQSRYLVMNRAWSYMTGRDPDAMRGLDDTALFPPAEAARIMEDDKRIISGTKSVMYEHVLTMKGEPRTLQVRKGPVFDEYHRVTGVYGISRDITDRRRAEEALRSSEARFRTIIENASAGILVVDAETGRVRYVNPAICRMLQYAEQVITSRNETGYRSLKDLADLCTELRQQRSEAMPAMERMLHRSDGSTIWVSVTGVGIELEDRPCVAAFFTDITGKRLLEEERVNIQKLDAIGTLAGGIAHDFNNLLQGVFGYLSLAKLKMDDRQESLMSLERAEMALHMTVKLTNQLLTFSKGGQPVRKPVELAPLVDSAARFALSGSHTGYRIESQEGLWWTESDERQISQVIQNIVLNADQAMPEGGQVVLSAKNVHAPSPDIPPNLEKGDYVMIRIRDTGIGIPAQYRTKIFDPYFTTKEKGSGLGLATAYAIVRNHGGMIDVASEPGKGSVFDVYLPAIPDSARMSFDAAQPVETTPSRPGRVLVMDDDEVVRDVARGMLHALGHAADFVEDGENALKKYEEAMRSDRPYDIVILDLTIRGGMGGVETVQKLLAIDPAANAVVSSGYSDDPATSRHQELGFKGFLKKPYNVKEMQEMLSRILR